jgi:hypothetical protein
MPNNEEAFFMPRVSPQQGSRQGITVLSLLLLIIALMVGGFFLVRYLRSRQPATQSTPLVRPTTSVLSHQLFDQLDLPGVVQVVSGDAMDLLSVGPYSLGRAVGELRRGQGADHFA